VDWLAVFPLPYMSSVPNPTARKLILLFDGTNDKVDDDVTNIVKLHNALNLDDPKRQKAYYQTGIGWCFLGGIVILCLTFTTPNF